MKFITSTIACLFILIFANVCTADFDVNIFKANFDDHNDQEVLAGKIDSMAIIRGNFEFYLTDGEMMLMDFGSGTPCAFYFDGKVRFKYTPPDEIERYQLHKFKKKDSLDCTTDRLLMYFTVELENFPDTSTFVREIMPKNKWYKIRDAKNDAVDNLHYYIASHLITDLLNDGPGTYIYADFYATEFEHTVFIEDPRSDDKYLFMHFLWVDHKFRRNIWGAYSDEDHLASHRGYLPIDITHYNIDSKIESGDNMMCKCRIDFTPIIWGQKCLQFDWFYQNKPIAVFDSKGNQLDIIHLKDCSNFAVVLKEPLALGEDNYIDIEYKNETLVKIWGFYLSKSQQYWYPRNINQDKATFDLSFKCLEDFTAVASCNQIDSTHEDRYNTTTWKQDYPVNFITFELGLYDTEDIPLGNLPPIRFYSWKFKDDKTVQNATTHDIAKAIQFFGITLGECPFDTIKVTEIPDIHGMGAPGLLHLSFVSTFAGYSANKGVFEQFRAHEVAHQWFGHIISTENYRDYWMMEGLAEYSGFLFYQQVFGNYERCNYILENWGRDIIEPDSRKAVGSKAGPVVLGYRLNSSRSYDYSNLVYEKSAYIFHMIRYLMHDFKTDSDDVFTAFLRDIVGRYKNKTITTEALRGILEEYLETDMTWFFNQYIYGVDIPTYTFSYDTKETPEGKFVVKCHVKQEDAPDNFMMIVPLTVVFEDEKYAHFRHWVSGPETEIALPPLPLKPKKIDFNTYNAVLCRVRYK